MLKNKKSARPRREAVIRHLAPSLPRQSILYVLIAANLMVLGMVLWICIYFVPEMQKMSIAYRENQKPVWTRQYTVIFTPKSYIPKAVVPSPFPNEYDVIIITENTRTVTAGGVIVPAPSGSITIKEAIRNATFIIEDSILNDLERQFLSIARANGWTNFSVGQRYQVTFSIPRRVLAEPQIYYLEINLPAFEVTIYQFYRRQFYPIKTYPCIIGHPDFQTPLMHLRIRRMYWNPDWSPPVSSWARKYNRLEAGGLNPLGKASIELGGYYMLHGTEYPPGQTISHGCVRLRNEDICELVWFLQNKYGFPCSAARKDQLMKQLTPLAIRLRKPLQAAVIYAPFMLRGDKLVIAQDIYNNKYFYTENELKHFLRKNGVNLTLDEKKIKRILEVGQKHGGEIPVAHLVSDPTGNVQAAQLVRNWWDPPPEFKMFALVTDTHRVEPMTVDLEAVLNNEAAKQKPF
jgi:lipoprotein-anchoring transpeptidase ErfK/SrfK